MSRLRVAFEPVQRLECTFVLPLLESSMLRVCTVSKVNSAITNLTSAVASEVLTLAALEALDKQWRFMKTCQRHEAPAE